MAESSKKQHDVKIYSLPTCIHCNHTKEFFKKHNIKYKDINVQENRNAAREMVEKTGKDRPARRSGYCNQREME